MDENEEDIEIKVFYPEDTKSLKLLGYILSNDTSLAIIRVLLDQELYTNQISIKTGIRVSLVIHHMKKMGEIGILQVRLKRITRKGKEHKFYKINNNILLLKKSKIALDKNGLFKKIFKNTVKFSAIFISIGLSSLWYEFLSIKESEMTSITIPLGILLFGFIIHTIFHSFPRKRKHD